MDLVAGANVFAGPNGQGKTDLTEAVKYLSTTSSHRVSSAASLIHAGAESTIPRGRVQAFRDDEHLIILKLEVTNGRGNVAHLNRVPLPRPRGLIDALRTIVSSSTGLAIVRGDPSDRRAWLDALVTVRWPRMAGMRADLDKILRQRNSLLKVISGRSLQQIAPEKDTTLQARNDAPMRIGAELLHARPDTLADILPHTAGAYETIAPVSNQVPVQYEASLDLAGIPTDVVRETLEARLYEAMAGCRHEEVAQGVALVGPQCDDVTLSIGSLPVKGYASHGESWSLTLILKLGRFAPVHADGIEPVLVLDDVFSELDETHRERLVGVIADTEQVFIAAVVGMDVPDFLSARWFRMQGGVAEPAEELGAMNN